VISWPSQRSELGSQIWPQLRRIRQGRFQNVL
jgi:hypothetical protein